MKTVGAALITGASKRIGKALALGLAERRYNVALHFNRSRLEAEHLRDQISEMGCRCEVFSCDLSRVEEVSELVGRAREAFPALSLLVNNASVFEAGSLLETEPELFERHLNINLRAPFFLTRDFARLARRGHIVNLIDARVFGTSRGYMAYSVSKHALYAFTRMAARELGPAIRVNAVAPGLILPPPGRDEAYLERMAQAIPLKKSGDPGKILRAVEYLIDNDFVTGECLRVDGGEWLK